MSENPDSEVVAIHSLMRADMTDVSVKQEDVLDQNYISISPVNNSTYYSPVYGGIKDIKFDIPNSNVYDFNDHRLDLILKLYKPEIPGTGGPPATAPDADTIGAYNNAYLSQAGVNSIFQRCTISVKGQGGTIEDIDDMYRLAAIEVLSRSRVYNSFMSMTELTDQDSTDFNKAVCGLSAGAPNNAPAVIETYACSVELPFGLFSIEKYFPSEFFPQLQIVLTLADNDIPLVNGEKNAKTSEISATNFHYEVLNPIIKISKLTMTSEWYAKTRALISANNGLSMKIKTWEHLRSQIANTSGKQEMRVGQFKNLRRTITYLKDIKNLNSTMDYPMYFPNGNLRSIRLLLDSSTYPSDNPLDTTIRNCSSAYIQTVTALDAYKQYNTDVSFKYIRGTGNQIIDNNKWIYAFDLTNTEVDSLPNDGKVEELKIELDFSAPPGSNNWQCCTFVERERTLGVIADTRRTFVYDT